MRSNAVVGIDNHRMQPEVAEPHRRYEALLGYRELVNVVEANPGICEALWCLTTISIYEALWLLYFTALKEWVCR